MMKCSKKQIVAFLLSICVVSSMLPATVFADENSQIGSSTDYTSRPVSAPLSVTASTGSDANTASVTFSNSIITDAIASAEAVVSASNKTATGISVELDITMPEGVSALNAVMPAESLESLIDAGVKELDLNGEPVSLTFSAEDLASMQAQCSGDITFSITPVMVTGSATALLGDNPAYNISINNGSITSFGGNSFTLSIPYTAEDSEDVGDLYGVYIDGSGNASRINDSIYNENNECMTLTTTYLATYGIAYDTSSTRFSDVEDNFAEDSIDYVVSRGLMTGRTDTTFEPDEAITRAELAEALGKMAGIDTSSYVSSSFTDVEVGSEEQPYIEWATQTGILSEISDGLFVPGGSITRQSLALALQQYAAVTGYALPAERKEISFSDEGLINSTYASAVTTLQKAAVMMGKDGLNFDPTYKVTRAEAALTLARYTAVMIDADAAQGFALNDEGQWMYYQNGDVLTGLQNLSVDGETDSYYFSEDGIMATDAWIEISDIWYYFGADGKKVVNATIGDYEVDSFGARIES